MEDDPNTNTMESGKNLAREKSNSISLDLTKDQMKSIVWILNNLENSNAIENGLKIELDNLFGCDVSYLDGDDYLQQLVDKIMLFLIKERNNMSEKTYENVITYIKENLQ